MRIAFHWVKPMMYSNERCQPHEMTASLEKLTQASAMFDEGWQSTLHNLIVVSNTRDRIAFHRNILTLRRLENMMHSRVFL